MSLGRWAYRRMHINKALTKPAQWKIPNDYASVRKMQIQATPLVLEDSAIARQIRKMATSISGQEDADSGQEEGLPVVLDDPTG